MKKHIANIITGSRIAFSLPILLIPLSSVWFYVLYLFCGLTDMIDGMIARKTGTVSSFGSTLDTASDIVFMSVCMVKLLPKINISIGLWIWITVIAIVKITNIVMGFIRRNKLVALHTFLNKTTGLLLFFLPLTLQFIAPAYSLAVVCTISTIAAIKESYLLYR